MTMFGSIAAVICVFLLFAAEVKSQKACPNATNVAEMCVSSIHTGASVMIDMSTYSTSVSSCKCTFTTTAEYLRLVPVTAPNNPRCGSAVKVNLASGNNLRFQCLVPGTVLDTTSHKDGSVEFEAYGSRFDDNYCMILEHAGDINDTVTVRCDGAAEVTVPTTQLETSTLRRALMETVSSEINQSETTVTDTPQPTQIPGKANTTAYTTASHNYTSSETFTNFTDISAINGTTLVALVSDTSNNSSTSVVSDDSKPVTTPTIVPESNSSESTTTSANIHTDSVSTSGPTEAFTFTTETDSSQAYSLQEIQSNNISRGNMSLKDVGIDFSSDRTDNKSVNRPEPTSTMSDITNTSLHLPIAESTIIFRPPTTQINRDEESKELYSEAVTQTRSHNVDITESVTNVPMLILEPVETVMNDVVSAASITTTDTAQRHMLTTPTLVVEDITYHSTSTSSNSLPITAADTARSRPERGTTFTPETFMQTQEGTWPPVTLRNDNVPIANLSHRINAEVDTFQESTRRTPSPTLLNTSTRGSLYVPPSLPHKPLTESWQVDGNFNDNRDTTIDNTYMLSGITDAPTEYSHIISDYSGIADMERIMREVINLLRQEYSTGNIRDITTQLTNTGLETSRTHVQPTSAIQTEGVVDGISLNGLITNTPLTITESDPDSPSTTLAPRSLSADHSTNVSVRDKIVDSVTQVQTTQTNRFNTPISSTRTPIRIEESTLAPTSTTTKEVYSVVPDTVSPDSTIAHTTMDKAVSKVLGKSTILSAKLENASTNIQSTSTQFTTTTKGSHIRSTLTTSTHMPQRKSEPWTMAHTSESASTTTEPVKRKPVSSILAETVTGDDIEPSLKALHKTRSTITIENIPTTSMSSVQHQTLQSKRTTRPNIVATSTINTEDPSNVRKTKTPRIISTQKPYEATVPAQEDVSSESTTTDKPDESKSRSDVLIFNVDRHLLLALIGGIGIFFILVAALVMFVNHSRKGRQMKATISGSLMSTSTGPPSFRSNTFDNVAFEEIEKGNSNPMNKSQNEHAGNVKYLRQATNYSGDIDTIEDNTSSQSSVAS